MFLCKTVPEMEGGFDTQLQAMYKCTGTWTILNETYLNQLFNNWDSLLFSSYLKQVGYF